ncbi:GroES-like protein [Melanomma pulvis-pyrius CBS 109.77]|uniref:GroES-like protein n=1 Tax=Melanomma pulvis-pyrius CBS 109.77 TaxID=1314802 RepID=A0A6A6X636_9PLEO|nr:GroES-like protein [Melanomma pulvis-pyrius CBS 109.77]
MGSVDMVQTALVGGPKDSIALSHTAPVPPGTLEDGTLAVEVMAVSLNPVDTKMLGGYHTVGAIAGCEYAGVVKAVGSGVTAEWNIEVGDRVSAAIMGMNPRRPKIGAFAQYSVAPAYCALKLPDDFSFAHGAGIGNAWYTVPWALFHALGLAPGPQLQPLSDWIESSTSSPVLGSKVILNTIKPQSVLVSGGSSSTGTCAIQLLKIAGFKVIATTSSRNMALVKSFGADAAFDYSDPNCASDIRAYTANALRFAIDCITTPETTQLCYKALGRTRGRYVSLDPFSESIASTRKIVSAGWVLGPELLGEEIAWPAPHGRDANPFAKDFCVVWNKTLQRLLDQGRIRTQPQLVRDTGLEGALGGLEEIRAKQVSGQKLIFTL